MLNFRSFLSDVSGNVAVITAVASAPMIGLVGIAVDSVRIENIRTDIAGSLDGAVLAGVVAEDKNEAVAKIYFDNNFPKGSVKTIDVAFKLNGQNELVGTAKAVMKTSFTNLFGIGEVKLTVSATAVAGKANNVCIMALAPTASQAMLVNSGAELDAKKCEIHVKSTANPAAILNASTNIDVARVCITGSSIIDNGSKTQNVERSCKTAANPFAGVYPVPSNLSCDYSNGNYSGSTILNPGVYCGWHNFNSGPNVTLRPGTYVIKDGGWNVNGGDWIGKGVTFYYADQSKIQFNSAVKADLSAPTVGTYAGALFVEKEGLSDSQFILDDNRGFIMEGNIYLPSREVVFNSGTTVNSQKITAVMRTVIFNGVRWKLEGYGGSGQTTEVRLMK